MGAHAGGGAVAGGTNLAYSSRLMLQEVPQSRTDRQARILVVDDDAWLLDALTESLVSAGEEVVACSSYEAAKRLLLEGPFDAMVTDVRLRGSNGLQLA